ncbi:MAG: DUF4286 family protein [Flammeovirgaceae bacterium]|nr:DUF4286 family protein [Flammeovirgaceae bacterium]
MILYNVTVNVEEEIREEWIDWMRNKHIGEVMGTGCFMEFKFMKLLSEDPNNTGTTYCIQYFCENPDKLNHYLENFAPALQKEHFEKYKGKHVAFRTLLEEI